MTIARRLKLLLATPIVTLILLVVFGTGQFERIESQGRVVRLQAERIATLGSMLRCFSDARISIRTYLLAGTAADRERAEQQFRGSQAELEQHLAHYGESLIPSGEDLKLLN